MENLDKSNDSEILPSGARLRRSQKYSSFVDLSKVVDKKSERKFTSHIEKYFGKIHKILPAYVFEGGPKKFWIKPTVDKPFHKLITYGMSSMAMVEEDDDEYFAELAIFLPPEWEIDESILDDENEFKIFHFVWPIYMLEFVSMYPHENDAVIWYYHTVANEHPPEPFSITTGFVGALIAPLQTFHDKASVCKVTRKKSINIFNTMPLYFDEMNFGVDVGSKELLDKLVGLGFGDVISPFRDNVCESYKGINDLYNIEINEKD